MLTNLTFLDISQNQLTELPNSIGLCKLTDLHLSDNFLITFPDSIGKRILFYKNHINSISFVYLAHITTLEILTANNNQIERLPNNIGKSVEQKMIY
jgi:Leucine-rich repeat (LRR) protein